MVLGFSKIRYHENGIELPLPFSLPLVELEIVVELGNLVPRNNLALQKVFVALKYLRPKMQYSCEISLKISFSCIEHINFWDNSLTARIFSAGKD